MDRQVRLNALFIQLQENDIFLFVVELTEFLQEADDNYTAELQKAIIAKLDGLPFLYQSFEVFLSDFLEKNPDNQTGFNDLYMRIVGDW